MRPNNLYHSLMSESTSSSVIRTGLIALLFLLIALAPVPLVSFPAALLVLVVLPGLQIVRWLGLYADWREARTVILGVASGILIIPTLIYWASLVFGFSRPIVLMTPLFVILGLAWLNSQRPLEKPASTPLFETRWQYLFFTILMAILIIGFIVPYIRGHTVSGIYPVEMSDWFKHYGISWSIRQTGVPPVDIFFYGDPDRGRLSYYYFFHLTVASLDFLHGGPSSIYHSFVILSLTACLSFVGVFYLLTRRILANTRAALCSLLFVTIIGGLDVIPMIQYSLERFEQKFPNTPLTILAFSDHIDSWASAPYLRLNALYVHYIWVPQHVAGLLAFTLGLYLFREVSHRVRLLSVAPLLLFAILGHSAWIAIIGFVCLGLYALLDVVRRWRKGYQQEAKRVFGAYALVAVGFLVISFPFLREMMSPNAPKSGIVFELPLTSTWPLLSPFKSYFSDTPWTRLLDLPIHYFVELGALLVCGLGGLWLFKIRRPHEPLMPLLILTVGVGFLVISCLASGRAWVSLGFTLNNDLGIRAIMPAQMVLALFSGYFLANLPKLRLPSWSKASLGALVGVMILLGIMAVGWEFWAMGAAKYLKPPRVDTATYQAYQAMPLITEPLSVVKHRTHDNASAYQLEFGARPPGFFTVEAAVFHPDLREVGYQFGLSRFAYLNRLPVWSYQMFKEMYVDYVYVGAEDRSPDLYPEKFKNPTYYEQIYEEAGISLYKVRDLPLDRMQARFAPTGVQFMGYILDEAPVYPVGFQTTSPLALVTAWRLEQSVGQDYTVYVHFVGPDGQLVGQADHQLWAWAGQTEGPTSSWDANKIYLDIIPIPKELLESTIPLQIGIGLWIPETGEYLQAEPVDLTFDENHRLVIGTFVPASSQSSLDK